MNHDDHSDNKPFLRTPLGLALLGFLAVGTFLLIVEHQAHIFTGNWFIWLLPLVCIGMHMFHGGHGGHGGSGGHDHGQKSQDRKGEGQ